MERHIYIASKPLQYFNIRNIVDKECKAHKTLIILEIFIDSETFTRSIREYDDTWDEVVYLTHKYKEYVYLLFHKCDKLYVELDASFVLGVLSALGRYKQMYIYEEGYGSYRRDRWGNAKGLKKWINRLTGVGDRVTGFSRFLTGQYLYLPGLYQKLFEGYEKKLCSFRKPFLTHLRDEQDLFLKLSKGYETFASIKNRRIGIYLTTHEINTAILEEILSKQSEFDMLYVKPHPHLRDLSLFGQYRMNMIRSNIMVEYILLCLIGNGNEVTVYHENSTSVIWFQDKIHDRNMGKTYSEYDIVSTYVRKHILNENSCGINPQ